MALIIYYSVYFLGCLIIATLGKNKTMGFWGYFFASIVLTPVLGLLLVLVSSPDKMHLPNQSSPSSDQKS